MSARVESDQSGPRRERIGHGYVVRLGGQLVDQLRVAHHRDQPGVWLALAQRAVVETATPAQPHARSGRRPTMAPGSGPPPRSPMPAATAPAARAVPTARMSVCRAGIRPSATAAARRRRWCAQPAAAPVRPAAATHPASRSTRARRPPARRRTPCCRRSRCFPSFQLLAQHARLVGPNAVGNAAPGRLQLLSQRGLAGGRHASTMAAGSLPAPIASANPDRVIV